MSTLTKAEIADSLLKSIPLNKQDAKDLVDAIFEEIRVALESGRSVKLSGFGNLVLRDKSARPGRNPKTGEAKEVSARRVVTFKIGQKLKAIVQQYQPEKS